MVEKRMATAARGSWARPICFRGREGGREEDEIRVDPIEMPSLPHSLPPHLLANHVRVVEHQVRLPPVQCHFLCELLRALGVAPGVDLVEFGDESVLRREGGREGEMEGGREVSNFG